MTTIVTRAKPGLLLESGLFFSGGGAGLALFA